MPVESTIAAPATCAASLASGGSVAVSSTRPATKSERRAGVDADELLASAVSGADGDGEPEAAATAGVDPDAAEERRRRRAASVDGRGPRSRPRAAGPRAQQQPQPRGAAAGRAATAAIVLTALEGRGPLLGPCLPARAVPTLLRADDGLRRPPALPRAVREPLPARFPGQIQGLGARRRLVAGESARPARRLPARLRAAVHERQHPALPDLPARRARLLDLLLGLAAVGGALDGRQRRADQEGALPAPARRVLDGRDPGGDVRA